MSDVAIVALGTYLTVTFLAFAVNATDAPGEYSPRERRARSARLALTAWAWPWHAIRALVGVFGKLREEADRG